MIFIYVLFHHIHHTISPIINKHMIFTHIKKILFHTNWAIHSIIYLSVISITYKMQWNFNANRRGSHHIVCTFSWTRAVGIVYRSISSSPRFFKVYDVHSSFIFIL